MVGHTGHSTNFITNQNPLQPPDKTTKIRKKPKHTKTQKEKIRRNSQIIPS